MKTIVALFLLITALVLADHFHLLEPKPQYPGKLNQLLQWLNQETPKLAGQEVSPEKATPGSKPEDKKLYQWRNEEGTLQISDTPPKDRVYQTIELTNSINNSPTAATGTTEPPAAPNGEQLKSESQCRFYLEQVDYYQKKMRFGGPGHIVDHWQRQIDWYRKLAFQTCAEKPE